MSRIEYEEIMESLNGLVIKPMKTDADKAFNNGIKSAIHAIETYRNSNSGFGGGGGALDLVNWDGGEDDMVRIFEDSNNER